MKLKFLFIILLLICPCICFSADVKSGGGGAGGGGGWQPFSWLMSFFASKKLSVAVSPETQKLLDNVHAALIQKNYLEVHTNLMNLLKIDPTNIEGNKILGKLIFDGIYNKELQQYENEAFQKYFVINPHATTHTPESELSLSNFLSTGQNVAGAFKEFGNIDFSSR